MFEKNFTPKHIHSIILAITGQVDPVADSAIDEKRFANLQFLESVADYLIDDIIKVAAPNNSPYASVHKASEEANKWISFWAEELAKYNEN